MPNHLESPPRPSLCEQGYQPLERVAAVRLYVVLLVVFGALYGLTAQHGPAWQDSGLFQWRIHTFSPVSHLGIALSHPLMIVLGGLCSLLPIGDDAAYRMNLLSAISAAVAVANVGLLVRRLVPCRPAAAWISALGLGLAHSVWWLGTVAESQTLLLALFTVELHVLLSLYRSPSTNLAMTLGLANGLALSAHNLALLALPAYGLMVIVLVLQRRMKWWGMPAFIAGWLLGAGGLLAIVVQAAVRVGWGEAVASALFGAAWRSDVLGGSGRAVAMGCGYIGYNFPNLLLPLGLVGLWAAWKRLGRWLALAMVYLFVVYLLFAVRYRVPDQFMFFLPFYAMLAVLAGLALAHLTAKRARPLLIALTAASVLLTPALYAFAPKLWQAANLPVPGRADLPYRDAARYWLVPWKANERSAQQFAEAALASVPQGAIIIADGTAYEPLRWMQQVHRTRPDVQLLTLAEATPQRIPLGTPSVYVTSDRPAYRPDWLAAEADLIRPEGAALYEVRWRR